MQDMKNINALIQDKDCDIRKIKMTLKVISCSVN